MSINEADSKSPEAKAEYYHRALSHVMSILNTFPEMQGFKDGRQIRNIVRSALFDVTPLPEPHLTGEPFFVPDGYVMLPIAMLPEELLESLKAEWTDTALASTGRASSPNDELNVVSRHAPKP